MKIRKARKEDLEKIAELQKGLRTFAEKNLGKKEYYGTVKGSKRKIKKYFEKRFKDKGNLFLVAEEMGEIAGYGRGMVRKRAPDFRENKIGKLNELFIGEESRRRGLGSRMICEFTKFFKKKKIKYMEIPVDKKNSAAIRCYKKAGFKEHKKNLLKRL